MIQNKEFIQEFVEEARTHVESAEALLVNSGELFKADNINRVFRAVHSIKGTAGFFGLKNIVSLAHSMENIFGEVRAGKLRLEEKDIDLLLAANDIMKEMVENVYDSEEFILEDTLTGLAGILNKDAAGPKQEAEKSIVTIESGRNARVDMGRASQELIREGIVHGHHLYEIKFRINQDLLNYREGPVKLFKKIQAVGMLVDTRTDHSEINSLEDVLAALENNSTDVYLGIWITSILEPDMLAEAIDIPAENIKMVEVHSLLQTDQSEPEPFAKNEPFNVVEIVAEEPAVIITEPAEATAEEPAEATAGNQTAVQEIHTNSIVEDSIRVNVVLLNDLMNMASEMVLGRNQLLRTLEDYRKAIPGLSAILQNIDQLTSGIQGKIMQTRMQPLGNVFGKFPRLIRDMSKALQKEMSLVIEGEGVELDKSIIEGLKDPLTHLIRNSADHGIEPPEERESCGKPREGLIKIHAYQEGGYVNIDIADDGRGMSADKIRKKAIEKNLINKSELDKLNEQEILKLIFKPGFSTAEKVTDISGRGVGMDVVKTNVERLGGAIEIYTNEKVGTTIRLMLPLTLAIIQALIVTTSDQRFAVPQANVKEIVRIKKGDTSSQIEYVNNSEVLRLRGKLLPIVRLSDVLGIQADQQSIDEVTRVLVLKIGARSFGLSVDSVLGSEEILVKPLPLYLKECICYSGVTIMGDGKTAMILDVEGIIKVRSLKFSEENTSENEPNQTDRMDTSEMQNVILFKCSGSETYALDMSMIARIIEIKREDIEMIGEYSYIQYNGKSLRVIRPEQYIMGNAGQEPKDRLYVIIPKLVRHPIGIITEKILDNINVSLKLSTNDVEADCLVGTAIHNKRTLLFINLYQLFDKADPFNYPPQTGKLQQKMNVLLVEDTPFFQRMTTSYLEEAGYVVETAKDGKEALEKLDARQFDIVVSDIQMPVMDGYEMIGRIKESTRFANLPVIALTSMSGEYNRETGLKKGFDYYEFKLDRDSLLQTMTKALADRTGGEQIA